MGLPFLTFGKQWWRMNREQETTTKTTTKSQEFAYFTRKNSSFARFTRAFITFVHLAAVLVRSMT